jgi:hypothetical protein
VDNQFQALQNQATEVFFSPGFPASGARSQSSTNPAFIWISLCYLISVDQQDLVLGGFLFLSFGPLADPSLFSYCLGF